MGGFAGPAGLALQTIGTIYGGISANSNARAEAAALDENGRRTILQGELDAQGIRRDERAATGDMIAAQGGSGLVMGSGSLADMIAQNAYNREVDIISTRRKAADDANVLYGEASQARSRGRQALIGAAFGAAATALQGSAQLRRDRILRDQGGAERKAQLGGGTSLVQVDASAPSPIGGVILNPRYSRVPPMRLINY